MSRWLKYQLVPALVGLALGWYSFHVAPGFAYLAGTAWMAWVLLMSLLWNIGLLEVRWRRKVKQPLHWLRTSDGSRVLLLESQVGDGEVTFAVSGTDPVDS